MESLGKWIAEHAVEQGFLVVLLLFAIVFLVRTVQNVSEKVDKLQAEFLRYVEQDHQRTVELLEETKNVLVNNTKIMERIERRLG